MFEIKFFFLRSQSYVWAGAKLFGMRRLLQVSPYRRNLSLKHLSCRTSLKIPLYNKFLPPPQKKTHVAPLFSLGTPSLWIPSFLDKCVTFFLDNLVPFFLDKCVPFFLDKCVHPF